MAKKSATYVQNTSTTTHISTRRVAFTEYFHCARWQAQPLNHLFIPVPIEVGKDAK